MPRANFSPRDACVVFGLRNVGATDGTRPPPRRGDPRLAQLIATARGEDCLDAAFAQTDGARPADLISGAKGRHSPPPFDDEAYYRAIARWLGCPYDTGEALGALTTLARGERGVEVLEVHRGDAGEGILVRLKRAERQLTLMSPAATWLPRIASFIARAPEAAQRIVIAPPQVTCRFGPDSKGAVEVAGRIAPLHAIAPTAVATRVLTLSQRVVFALALVALSVAVLAAPSVMLPAAILTITAVLVGYAAARGAAIFAKPPYPARKALRRADLPPYSVLIPLYREDAGVAALVRAMRRLDYPPDKLDLMFLVEADDTMTRAALKREAASLPARVVVVPPGTPRTKPRALNAGLRQARGTFVTIFDAEDRPHPFQLRLAAETFAAAPPEVAALQARLVIDHQDNWLTAMFAIEYACLFDHIMPSVAGRERLVLLGGTSNHFRRETLLACGGWDPYNVTEDADLAVRLRRGGHRILMIDSTTAEEAPLTMKAWLRQRSRWFKGYMQTWLVHNRRPLKLWQEMGWRDTALFHLFIVGALMAALTHLLFTAQLAAAAFGLFDPLSGPHLWMTAVQLGAITFGYGATFALGAVSLSSFREKPLSPLMVAWFPLYWLLMGAAVFLALYDLVRRPHHWRKTTHHVALRPSRLRQRAGKS